MNQKYEVIVNNLYENISQDIIDLIADPEVSDFITILEVITRVSGMVEVIRFGEKPIRGKEKKIVTKKLGRVLIDNNCPDELKDSVLDVYDKSIDNAIELLIDFAKNNKILRKTSKCVTACC